MKSKYRFFLTILLIIIIFLIGCVSQQQIKAAEASTAPSAGKTSPSEIKQTRDDFGCFPSSCSSDPDPYGKQQCENWKAGKAVQWPPDCSLLSDYPGCVKLCETEKKAGTQSGSPKTTSAPTQKHVFNTLPSLVKAEFASDVGEEDKNFTIQGISTMDFYLQKWFGKSTNKPSGLKVGAGAPADMGSGSQVVVEGGKIVILMETGSFVWKRQSQSNKEIGGEWRPRLSAHEYIHVYQFQNGCDISSGTSPVPKWFGEGEAEWLSYKATIEAGQLPPLNIPQLVTPQAKQVVGSLQSFESPTILNFQAYFLYTMAVDYLMKDKPIKALDNFCANLGNRMTMPKAFETAFGISLDKFYEEFESYRKIWSSESSSGQNQIPQEYCAQFASLPSCSSVGEPGSQNYNSCKQCYLNK